MCQISKNKLLSSEQTSFLLSLLQTLLKISMVAKKKMDWFNWVIVALGVLVVLVAPGMPLYAITGSHVFEHYILGLVLVLLGLWNWWSQQK